MDVRVLVVDDQPRFLAVARTVVERADGFTIVATAADGAAGVDAAAGSQPDLVLMDIHMPVLDGIDASKRIVAAAPRTVVILLSSYSRDDLPIDLATTGASGYLNKEELSPAVLRAMWEQFAPR